MRIVIVFSALVSALIIAPVSYMMADNQVPYEYDYATSYMFPARPHLDRQVTMHWVIRRVNRICPGHIVRIITDESGARVTYDPTPAAMDIHLGDKYMDRTFFLPPNLKPGPHFYKNVGYYACNPLQRFWPLVVETRAVPFEVVE
jgi:hypothetical protein